jgi:hypothetical protein
MVKLKTIHPLDNSMTKLEFFFSRVILTDLVSNVQVILFLK